MGLTMSADSILDLDVITDNGVTHSFIRVWAAKVREQPAVRLTREQIVEAFKDDPKMADAVKAVQDNIKKGAVVFVVSAESGSSPQGPSIQLSVRFG